MAFDLSSDKEHQSLWLEKKTKVSQNDCLPLKYSNKYNNFFVKSIISDSRSDVFHKNL